MKKIIAVFLLLSLLLLSSCNEGISKVKYTIEGSSSSNDVSSSINNETESAFEVQGNKVIVDNKITSGNDVFYVNQSSNPKASSSALPYNPDEELIFDDDLLKKIILRNLNKPLGGEAYKDKVTVENCIDLKFDTLKTNTTFNVDQKGNKTIYTSASVRTNFLQVYEYGKTFANPDENFLGKINSYKVLSQIPSMKKIEIYITNNTFAEDTYKYDLPIVIDISPLFVQKSLVELNINVFAGASPFILNGLSNIGDCSNLKSVTLINCGITDGSPLLYLNPKVLKVLKYGGNPIANDVNAVNFYNTLKKKYPNTTITK